MTKDAEWQPNRVPFCVFSHNIKVLIIYYIKFLMNMYSISSGVMYRSMKITPE